MTDVSAPAALTSISQIGCQAKNEEKKFNLSQRYPDIRYVRILEKLVDFVVVECCETD